MTDHLSPHGSGPSHFPAHESPRVWVLSSGDSPVGIYLTRRLLAHGDYVVTGVTAPNPEREDPRRADFEEFLEGILDNDGQDGWRERLKPVSLDIRLMSQCQAAIAAAIEFFGRVDILFCCSSQAIIGTVEELAASERTQMIVKDQFETNYFGPVNLIKAVLPQMRKQKSGHILALGGITGHLGTPGLGVYCAAGWALEGFCDSLAYEIAPFNIRLTIVQSSIEVGMLSNLITSVPPMFPAYSPETNHAPLFREIMNSILARLPSAMEYYSQSPDRTKFLSPETDTSSSLVSPTSSSNWVSQNQTLDADSDDGTGMGMSTSEDIDSNLPLSSPAVVSLYPPLSPEHLEKLTAETIYAISAIGGHENPPARHIVGVEAIASVKEKLKTVSEELEDFVECSCAVDINQDGSAVKAGHEGETAHD